MNLKKIYAISQAMLFGGVILYMIAALFQIQWLMIVGVLIVLCGVSYNVMFYRCPCCKKSLDIIGEQPKYCPYCGSELE